MKRLIMKLFIFTFAIISPVCAADSAFIGKIYHPYVLPLEREVEWRMSFNEEDDDEHENDNNMTQRFAFGHWISERVTMQAYLLAERSEGEPMKVSGYELETRWMITEQGEYAIDWGALFAIRRPKDEDEWKIAAGLLAEKETGKFSTTGNLFLIYEPKEREKEAEFRLQHRYRWMPEVQPGIELFVGDDFYGLGPSFMGIHRLEGQRQIKWEAGFIFGLDSETSDRSFRFGIEYEF